MKTMVMTMALLVSASGFATTLSCQAYAVNNTTNDQVHEFELTNIEGEKIESNLESTLDPFHQENGVMIASFSDECSDLYEVSFLPKDFAAILNHTQNTLVGNLVYGTSDNEVMQTALIECKIKQ